MTTSVHKLAISMSADMSAGIQQLENVRRALGKLEKQRSELSKKGQTSQALDEEIKKFREYKTQIESLMGVQKSYFREITESEAAHMRQNATLDNSAGAMQALQSRLIQLKAEGRDTSGIQAQINALNGLEDAAQDAAQATQQQINANTKGNAKIAQAMNQLGFAVEDFMSTVDTMGPLGALRGANNNLSMMARILAGTGEGALYGSIVGVAIGALPMLIRAFYKTKEEAQDLSKELQDLSKTLDFREEMKEIRDEGDLMVMDVSNINSVDAAKDKLKELNLEMVKLHKNIRNANLREQEFAKGMTDRLVPGTSKLRQVVEKTRGTFVELSDDGRRAMRELVDSIEGRLLDNIRNIKPEIEDIRKELVDILDEESFNMTNQSFSGPGGEHQFMAMRAAYSRFKSNMVEVLDEILNQEELINKANEEGIRAFKEKTIAAERLEEQIKRVMEETRNRKEFLQQLSDVEKYIELHERGATDLQRITNKMRDDINDAMMQARALQAAFGKEATDKLFNKAQIRAMEDALKAMKALRGDDPKDIRRQGEAIQDDLVEDQIARAQSSAIMQIQAAIDKDKEDAPRSDVIEAIKQLALQLEQARGFFREVN